MSNLSDIIEGFIKELMDSNEESAIEIQRNLLAQQFDCSPSQINYVLTTRFNNDRGYVIESRRGGGGYIRIFKVKSSKQDELDKIFGDSIGESITINKALDIIEIIADRGIISQREQRIMKRAINDRALKAVSYDNRNKFRADILKEMILALIEQ